MSKLAVLAATRERSRSRLSRSPRVRRKPDGAGAAIGVGAAGDPGLAFMSGRATVGTARAVIGARATPQATLTPIIPIGVTATTTGSGIAARLRRAAIDERAAPQKGTALRFPAKL
jgi:hypothetical protein